MLIGANTGGESDLPRNSQGRALTGDPRNDENIIVSQLHLLFLRFHNRVVDHLGSSTPPVPADALFDEAQRTVRWHYQWIVAHDFLRRIVGPEVIDDILVDRPYATAGGEMTPKGIDLRFFGWRYDPFMPVEFSVAGYRFGHSMIRPDYRINTTITQDIPIFVPAAHPGEFDDLRGFRPLPKQWTIDWSFFFDVGDASHLQPARLIDSKLAEPLHKLPGLRPAALARRNLERGAVLGLPSGQRVAAAMCVPVLSDDDLGIAGMSPAFVGHAPLWFYILKESELGQRGKRLGAVGGRIVAEVLLGLLKGDPFSYINVEPCWQPTLPSAAAHEFTMADMVNFVDSPEPNK
jgi:heme peroxidase